MGTINTVQPVKFFIGIISVSSSLISKAEPSLINRWGEIDFKSGIVAFDYTNYYKDEMGEPLVRQWVSFKTLINPGQLANIKTETNKIEDSFALAGKRRINLDPGYLALSKIVLASTKDFSHRIYLSDGIYAEITTLYKNRDFIKLPWTYPDYMSDFAKTYFFKLRETYSDQLELKK